MVPSVDSALAAWLAACAATPVEAEGIAVERAAGRVTAVGVEARWSSPAVACAAMDGIAVRAADTAAAPVVLGPDLFDEIDTGDPLPDGRDVVVMCEHVVRGADGGVALRSPARAGQHVRAVGEDMQAGEPLLPAGHRLRPADLAAIAAGGHRTVVVRRRPVVAIVPTGDEVRPLGSDLRRGEVLDTNSLMLGATFGEAGAATRIAPVQPDDPGRIAAAVRRAAGGADLVAVLAGSSAGRDDHTAQVVRALGSVVVHGVAVRPAHPVLLGVLHGRRPVPVIGVPGYPVSAALAVDLFAQPLLAQLLDTRRVPRPTAPARLAADVASRPDVDEYVLVTLDAMGSAVPLRRGAGARSALVRAKAMLRVPPGSAGYRAGDRVDIELLLGAPVAATGADVPAVNLAAHAAIT
jgi:putative molybdopterin biosynthesis protein